MFLGIWRRRTWINQEEFTKIKMCLTNLLHNLHCLLQENKWIYVCAKICSSLLNAASPIKWTQLEIVGIVEFLGMIYLQISISVRYCSKKLCFLAPMALLHIATQNFNMSPVWCYCRKVHFILKHKILFIVFLSCVLILRNSDGWTGWSWRSLPNSITLWFSDSTNVSVSTLHLWQSHLFPGLCKTSGVTSSLSKVQFWIVWNILFNHL